MGLTLGDVDLDRVATLTAREESEFRSRRMRSRELWQEATEYIPRGVPSSFQDTPPQPVFIDHGKGSHVWDVDGNEYVDFHNGFGVMVVGHAHPAIVAAVESQMHRGSHFAQPVAENIVVARGAGAPVPAAAVALHQQRHRVHARRDPPGAGIHRSRADHQDRGLVPRPPRRAARLRRTSRRRDGRRGLPELGAHDRRHPGVDGRPSPPSWASTTSQRWSAHSPRILARWLP